MRQLHFDQYRIDLDAMALFKGDLQIRIGKKTLDALLFLIENKAHTVSHETLRRYLWKSEKISASTIPMCIAEIRKALTDDAENPRVVSSIRGQGYRFIAEVRLHANQCPAGEHSEELAFVGRASLISSFQGIVRSTNASLRGRMVCVIGEAGVGKTRLVSEIVHRVTHQVDLLSARTTSRDADSAYSIWAQVLRNALSRYPDNRELKDRVTRVAAILPDLYMNPPRTENSSTLNQSIFFLQYGAALKSITRNRALLLVLEDIHQADLDSMMLLEHLASETANAPIIILATARPSFVNHYFPRASAAFLSSGDTTVFQLSPFTRQEVACFLDPYLENRIEIAAEIFQKTGGNAFYVTHLISLWRRDPDSQPPWRSENFQTEDGVSIVARQLSDLPEFTLKALSIASAIGNGFPISLVADVLGVTSAEAADRLEPALVARIIHNSEFNFEFCHALLRDSLYCSLSHRARMELHVRIASTLEEERIKASAAEIFSHYLRAFPLASASLVCTSGLAAGAEAISRFAFHEAKRTLHQALKIADNALPEDADLKFNLMITLANSLLYTGESATARALFRNAAELARRFRSADRLAQCGLMMAPDFLSIEVGTYDPDLAMILQEALQTIPPTSVPLRARLLARLSQLSQWSCSLFNDSEAMAQDALNLAQDSKDSEAMIAALAASADASHGPDRTNKRIELIVRLQKETLAKADVYSFLLQQTRLIAALLEKGDLRRIGIENERYRQIAEEICLPQYRWFPASTDSMLACLSGNLELAERHADRCKELIGDHVDENFRQTFACQYVMREIERDRSIGVVSLVEDFSAQQPSVFSWAAAVAWIQWDSGREDAAREALRQFSPADLRKIFREPGGTIGLAALSEVAAYVGDRSQVRILYGMIAPTSSRFATAGYGVAYFGSLARYAGLLAIALRRFSEARRLTNLAVRQESSRKARSWHVYSTLDSIRANQESLTINRRDSAAGARLFRDLLRLSPPRAIRCIHEAFDRPSA